MPQKISWSYFCLYFADLFKQLQRDSQELSNLKRDKSQHVTSCGFACTCLYLHLIYATPFKLLSNEIPDDIYVKESEKVAFDLWFMGP